MTKYLILPPNGCIIEAYSAKAFVEGLRWRFGRSLSSKQLMQQIAQECEQKT